MANLLVINSQDWGKFESIKDSPLVKKIISDYEVFQIQNFNLNEFKKEVSQKKVSRAVFAYFQPHKDLHFLRAFKSLSLEAEIIALFPDLSSIAEYDNLNSIVTDDYFYATTYNKNIMTSAFATADGIIVENETDLALVKEHCANAFAVLAKDVEAGTNFIKPKKKYKVSVVMLTFNQLEDTKKCVESFMAHTQNVNYELIFVDNGSTKDNTKEYLEELAASHENIKTIFNPENMGFAIGNNQGIAVSEGEYVLLLNNDVLLTDNWLSRMLAVIESSNDVGIVGPVTNNASGKQVVAYSGTEEDVEGINRFAEMTLLKNAGYWLDVERIIGFCVLIKREVLWKIGGLDEVFGPGGYEDYDYCMRVKQAGYKVVIASDVFIYHIGGKGYSSNKLNYTDLRKQNIEIFIEKWVRKTIEIMEKIPNG
jgi:GT2 family glycosyltransferase